jgi:general secretion pathway protein A
MQNIGTAYKNLGFKHFPFSITPDRSFFHTSARYVAALQHLRFGIASGGFTMLTGEVGLGKTLLCRQVQSVEYSETRIAYILNPPQTYLKLLQRVHADLGSRPVVGGDEDQLQADLEALLFKLAAKNQRVAVLVDEAHRLPPEVLERLRLLSNLETDQHKLLSLVLVGQPELDRTLATKAMRPLAQRISIRYRLQPMSLTETSEYIRHRIKVAHKTNDFEFTGPALCVIHGAAKGVPRRINQIADRCVLDAYLHMRLYVDFWSALRAAREVKGTWL